MSKAAKIWLIVAAALVLAGCVIFCCALNFLDWDFNNLSTENYETIVYEFDESLDDFYIETDTADVEIVASRDIDTAKVVCYENTKEPHSVSFSDGTLTVEQADERAWTDYINIVSDSPKITVYLPQGEFGNLSVKTITGDIDMENMMAYSIELSTSTGDISLENVDCNHELSIRTNTGKTKLEKLSCESFVSEGDTGDIFMVELSALRSIVVERDTGDVMFRSCESPIVRVLTDTGDVYGSFVKEMIFNVETDTGDVSVPQSAAGGECYITTDTGDVRIEIED